MAAMYGFDLEKGKSEDATFLIAHEYNNAPNYTTVTLLTPTGQPFPLGLCYSYGINTQSRDIV